MRYIVFKLKLKFLLDKYLFLSSHVLFHLDVKFVRQPNVKRYWEQCINITRVMKNCFRVSGFYSVALHVAQSSSLDFTTMYNQHPRQMRSDRKNVHQRIF